jgi:hypothetical protein
MYVPAGTVDRAMASTPLRALCTHPQLHFPALTPSLELSRRRTASVMRIGWMRPPNTYCYLVTVACGTTPKPATSPATLTLSGSYGLGASLFQTKMRQARAGEPQTQ